MKKFDVFIDVQDNRWEKDISCLKKVVLECRDATLCVVQNDVPFLKKNKNFSVNLALSDDKTVSELNKRFRGIDKPTNVLSFACVDDDDFEDVLRFEDDVALGDVIVAYETMKSQAQDLDVELKNHFCHLWVHGLLHILGYDHIKDHEREIMEAKEVKIMQVLGFNNPYEE